MRRFVLAVAMFALPVQVPTPPPLPLPTPTPSSTAGLAPPIGTPSLGGVTIPGGTSTGAPAGAPAPPSGALPASQPYQPSPDEQASLPSEPNRIAYEQQQQDVAGSIADFDVEYAVQAIEAGGGTGRFGWPLSIAGRPPITQRFGCTDVPGEPYKSDCPTKRWHTGIDLGLPAGTPVFAADSGVAKVVPGGAGYGNFVMVVHGNGYVTLYAHLEAFAIPDGQVVKRGDLIGFVGSTGFSTGSHLHFEIRYQQGFVDPCVELEC